MGLAGPIWYAAGVPVINYISNPVYLLTDDDALQWVARERLPQVAALFADLLTTLDGWERIKFCRGDMRLRKAVMKLLRRLLQARTTLFGLKPIH